MSKLLDIFNKIFDFASKKAGINLRHLISFCLSKLYSKKTNSEIIAFGSTEGDTFIGNSKDLFLFLHEHSDYYCVWFTKSKEIYDDLKNSGYHVLYTRNFLNLEAIKILRASEFIFITNGFGDILLVDFSPETKIIHLDHGSPIKVIGHALKENFLGFFEKRIQNFWNKRISYFIVTCEETRRTKSFSYNLPIERVLVLGYPRNSILITNTIDDRNKIKERLNLPKDHFIILYAPTFRSFKTENPLTPSFLKSLNDILLKDKKIFLYKPHPFSPKIDINKYENIKTIDPKEDIRDLLVISDILITDYSGVFYDYLLTLRPILFFAYDFEEYKEKRDFYYDYETFVPGPIIRNNERLLEMLSNIEPWAKEFEDKRIKTRDRFNKYHDGKAIERILNYFNLKHH